MNLAEYKTKCIKKINDIYFDNTLNDNEKLLILDKGYLSILDREIQIRIEK